MRVNASISSLLLGLKPVIMQKMPDRDGTFREYFRFRNGQVRRQIGHGHSRMERAARREVLRMRKIKVIPDEPLGDLARALITARVFAKAKKS